MTDITETFRTDSVNFHLRDDNHFLSREDWNVYMDYLNIKFGEKERRKYYIPITTYDGKVHNDEEI